MELLLGLDVGTSSVKCLAFDAKGEAVASATQPLRLYTPRLEWVEQDPEQIWNSVVHACRAVTASLRPKHQIIALSISAQGGTTIPLNADGFPTHPAFSWMDERAEAEALDAQNTLGKDWVYQTTGWALSKGLPLNHIAWFRKNKPPEFARTKHFCFVNDFVLSRLCGEYVMDPANAGITQLYNLANDEWDSRLLDHAGIKASQLSAIRPSGEVVGKLTAKASELTGLPAGAVVINGAHDQYCAALGTGTAQPGKALLSCGTAWVVLAVPQSLEKALQSGMSVSRHAIQGLFGGIRSMGAVGASVEWLLELFWPDLEDRTSRYHAFNQAAVSAPPGSRGLIFQPLSGGHLETGERVNHSLAGLSLHHTRGDIARALMEGIAFELRWSLDEAAEAVQIDRLKMIGGAAHSPVWPQIVADITRRPLELVSVSESASLGAAILAGTGAGLFSNVWAALESLHLQGRQVLPDPTLDDFYSCECERYRYLWNLTPHHLQAAEGSLG